MDALLYKGFTFVQSGARITNTDLQIQIYKYIIERTMVALLYSLLGDKFKMLVKM